MKTKLVGIIVCMLIVVATVAPVAAIVNKNKNSNSNIHNIEWEATYGGDLIDWGNCIQQTTDGGYIISGTYFRNAWSLWCSYFYLLKIDAYGNEEWYKIYGEYDSEHVAKSVQQTNDGGYIIAGVQGVTHKYDAIVQKTDESGNLVWSSTYGDHEAFDIAQSAQQTSDGGYIVTGWTNSYEAMASDILLIKIDAEGNDEWIKTIGGDEDDDDVTYDVYLGTIYPPVTLVSAYQSEESYIPQHDLYPGTKYYWQIIAHDSQGASTFGQIWSFTTK